MTYLFVLAFMVAHVTLSAIDFDSQQWRNITRVRLILPSVEIYTPVTRFPLGSNSWKIDPWETEVGHFEGTGWIESQGNMVLGGHVEYPDNRPGIFADLDKVELGDAVLLWIGAAEKRYRVTEIKLVEQSDLTVLYPTRDAYLTLITCDEASYDPQSKTYRKRLVVIAVSTQG